jgi:hypothetical protein
MSIVQQPEGNSNLFRGEGTDCLWHLVQDGHVRPLLVGGVLHVSMVDVVHTFKPNIKNPRQYWKDHKRSLLAKDWEDKAKTPDPELVANLYQLKLVAGDGKLRLADVGSLWLMTYVGGRINQDFYKLITKTYTMVQLKYRIHNISRGAEWAAEYVHEQMTDSDPIEPTSAFEDMGYRRDKADRFAPPDTDRDRWSRNEH